MMPPRESERRAFVERLAGNFRGRVEQAVPMRKRTTFRIGGPADLILHPRSREELGFCVELLQETGLPWRVLGRGSNLLVSDAGVREALIDLREGFSEISLPSPEEREGAAVAVLDAGASLPEAAKVCQDGGLSGLEWAAGIPGSIGGALAMNAGSLGGSIGELVQWVEWFIPGKGFERKPRQELNFEYRRMNRPPHAVLTGCGLELRKDDPISIRERTAQGLKWRREHQPLSLPSAGSVFKNPRGDYAGRLIEDAGLKGAREGDAQISEVHANFIVNLGRASSSEVKRLIERAREAVFKEFGVELELEIEILGEEPP